ncbi:serine/threonine-protein phosphatase 2A activator 1, variant 2 [Coprinopsis cinerea AmutBmut pab1-1]|nr:serine/threonine-protein phosphatase 2A activator 1, variant 2 [Coprinopsis cinerea AmutBmut pab1-1]
MASTASSPPSESTTSSSPVTTIEAPVQSTTGQPQSANEQQPQPPQQGRQNQFHPPAKRILIPDQLTAFQNSQTHADIVEFITRLNKSVKGAKLSDRFEGEGRPIIQAILKILDEVQQIAKETPPIENPGSRFGNPAFRTFYDRVGEATEPLHTTHLVPLGLPPASIPEIGTYFKECWGNRTRIDYGSGMEVNFICWLICLEKLGLFSSSSSSSTTASPSSNIPSPQDASNTTSPSSTGTSSSTSPSPAEDLATPLVLRIFWTYIQTMRLLQSQYWLEPAGSHGVWGLDDYHFLPFLWGSGQLVGHKFIRPRAIHDAEVVEEYAKDYMYFACIAFINSVRIPSSPTFLFFALLFFCSCSRLVLVLRRASFCYLLSLWVAAFVDGSLGRDK